MYYYEIYKTFFEYVKTNDNILLLDRGYNFYKKNQRHK